MKQDDLSSKIMVVASESGGHIFPAIAFCQEVQGSRQRPSSVTFVTLKTDRLPVRIPAEFGPVFLDINKNIFWVFKLVINAFSLIWRIRPDVILGFGGYVTVPFVILGRLMRKRTIIHEQNAIPGRANRFLSLFADRVAVSFLGTVKYFKNRKNVFLAKYPLRINLERVAKEEALEFFGFSKDLFTLLIMGGSQGAKRLNEKLLEALKKNACLDRFQIIHLSGSKDFENTVSAYKGLSVKAKVFSFLDAMYYAYCAADLVVSRSGAGAVFEIMHFGLPSILIPYPYALGHQTENAKFLAQKGGAILLEDAKMAPEMINGLLDIFLDDSMRRKAMSAIVLSLKKESENLKLKDAVFL